MIRGASDGYASVGNTWFDQSFPQVPGARRAGVGFGSTLAVLSLTADRRPDLVVAARGEQRADSRVMVVESGPGVFAPDERRTTTLSGAAARLRMPLGGRIRLARALRRLTAGGAGFTLLMAVPAPGGGGDSWPRQRSPPCRPPPPGRAGCRRARGS